MPLAREYSVEAEDRIGRPAHEFTLKVRACYVDASREISSGLSFSVCVMVPVRMYQRVSGHSGSHSSQPVYTTFKG